MVYDENRKIRFIALDTFQGGTFPSAWETVGVVAMRKGNLVWIVAKESPAMKFMDVYPYIVLDYKLDGAEHTATLKLHGSETLDFKYTASSTEEFLTALKSFLAANSFTDWSAYIMDETVYLQYDNYTSVEYLSASITQATGITLKAKCEVDMPTVPSARRKCGNNGNFVWNVARAKQFFVNDQTNTAYNPTADVTSVPNYPICWPAFAGTSQYQTDHCLWLRMRYCKDPDKPTLTEWEAYIDDIAPMSPAMTGSLAPKWRGREVFDNIKDITYTATDGTQKPLYPGVNYCSKTFDRKGYMPTQYEFYELFKDITLGLAGVNNQTADAVNRSLYAIGGTTIPTTMTYWLCDHCNSSVARNASSSGNTGTHNFYLSDRCISALILALPLV